MTDDQTHDDESEGSAESGFDDSVLNPTLRALRARMSIALVRLESRSQIVEGLLDLVTEQGLRAMRSGRLVTEPGTLRETARDLAHYCEEGAKLQREFAQLRHALFLVEMAGDNPALRRRLYAEIQIKASTGVN